MLFDCSMHWYSQRYNILWVKAFIVMITCIISDMFIVVLRFLPLHFKFIPEMPKLTRRKTITLSSFVSNVSTIAVWFLFAGMFHDSFDHRFNISLKLSTKKRMFFYSSIFFINISIWIQPFKTKTLFWFKFLIFKGSSASLTPQSTNASCRF